MNEATKKYIHDISEAMFRIQAKADAENRKPTAEESAYMAQLQGALDAYLAKPEKALTQPQSFGAGATTRPLALAKNERLVDFYRPNKGEWTLGDFVRSGMGVKNEAEAIIPSTATVPLFIGAEIIDDVRALARITQAGAKVYPISGKTNICRIEGDPTVYEHAHGTDDITETEPTLTAVEFDPQTLAALVPISMEVVQDSQNLDAALRTSIAKAFASKLDTLGIATILADGAIPTTGGEATATWAGMVTGLKSALAENQDIPKAIISNASDYGDRVAELATDSGVWLGPPPVLANVPDLFSTSMTIGSACMGDFAAGIGIAMRTDLNLEMIRFGKPTAASHLLVATMRAEVYVTQPKALYLVVTAGA